MRIIAGQWRGRRIDAPRHEGTRPILDRAKTVLFDLLGHRLAVPGRLPPVAVLDLFAGSGALGLEALSRGARFCLLIEQSRSTAEILRRNLDRLGIVDEARVMEADVTTCAFPSPPGPEETRGAGPAGAMEPPAGYGLVFMDPPYRMLTGPMPALGLRTLLKRLATDGTIAADALIVVRHPIQSQEPPDLAPLIDLEQRDVGTMTFRFMARPPGSQEPLP